jgi:CMP-N-acetylneuraminic acid synthetase
MKKYGFIFARGGSKGLPNKNIKNFFGIPLIAQAIKVAQESNILDRLIVSTDSKEIADVALKYGAEVPFLRPADLATDSSAELDAWRHALNFFEKKDGFLPEILVSVPTTSPLRLPIDIIRGVDRFCKGDVDLVVGITLSKKSPYFNMVTKDNGGFIQSVCNSPNKVSRRQDAPKTFDITTVIYVAESKYVMNTNNLYDGRIAGIEIPAERSIDIDDEIDFQLAELLYRKRLNNYECK